MGLSCSCDDFDKGDHDKWWEPGQRNRPPAGEKCCECNAPLPDEPLECWLTMEVYDPGDEVEEPRDFAPGHSVTCDVLNRHLEQLEEAHEDDMYEFQDEHGWDDDYERFERVAGKEFRCERCSDLVAAIEGLGYCAIGPGDLIENHVEYVAQNGHACMKWVKGQDGVLNPIRLQKIEA